MSGKTNSREYSFEAAFGDQVEFQQKLLEAKYGQDRVLPDDDVDWFSYHMMAIQEELGEVLASDKRWKTHRNTAYNKEEKLEELADVFISAINMAIFSDFDAEAVVESITRKIQKNNERLGLVKK